MRAKWRALAGAVCVAAICQASSAAMLKFGSPQERFAEADSRAAAVYRYGIGGSGASSNKPEPVRLALLGAGLLGVGTMFRRRMLKS